MRTVTLRSSRRGWFCLVQATCLFVWALPALVLAGDEQVSRVVDDETIAARKDAKADANDEKPDYPKFEEFAKEHSEVLGPKGESGFFALHYNKKNDQLLAVIPKDMLGTKFLIANSIAGGPGFAGYMWGDFVVFWEERDKKLVLIEPDLRYKRPPAGKSPVADAIDRTYTDRILLAVPIVAKTGQDPVIDLGDVFKQDFARAAGVFRGRMDRSLSKWAAYKCFPDNVEVEVEGAFMQGDSGGTRAIVHHSMVRLPKNDYEPRAADDRIGYFLTAVMDWATPHEEDTIFKRYIHRWDLRKSEPDKTVSDADPDHQIVYYIEKTVPIEYRRYVREGILEWNKAFAAAGYRNAIKVEQQTETVHADKDPEDVRYAFFRWIVSGRSFAMGPSLANPLTGQILDADIIFDDSMARAWEMQYARYTGTGLARAEDPQLQEFLKHHPEWDYKPLYERLLPESTQYSGVDLALDPEVAKHLCDQPGFCTYAQGLAHEFAFNMAFLKATGNAKSSEAFVGQMIKEVVTHEVGHTLGLRHNFKASSWKSIDEILRTTDADEATCASVMDYNPGVFDREFDKQTIFVTQTVGPYDIWAIEYGYRPFSKEGTDCKNEGEMLQSIAARIAEKGHDYATDEDTTFFSPDPLTNRFDNGSDVIAYAKHRMDMVRELQKDMADWAVEDGESYHKLRRVFDMMIFEYSRSASFAARYIGGQQINRDHKGDPNARPPIQIVEVEKQREALDFLMDTIFSEKDFQFEPELLNMLAAGRWSHWGSDAMDSQLDYPIHDRIASAQWGALFQVLNPFTLARVYDAELKVPVDQDAITCPELIARVTDAIWSELDRKVESKCTTRKPYCSSFRRSLQRQHLSMLTNIALSRPGGNMPADVHAVTCMNLKDLSKRIGSVIEGDQNDRLDDFTRAHLVDARSRIDRVLSAEYQIN